MIRRISWGKVAAPLGFEPRTVRLEGKKSNRLRPEKQPPFAWPAAAVAVCVTACAPLPDDFEALTTTTPPAGPAVTGLGDAPRAPPESVTWWAEAEGEGDPLAESLTERAPLGGWAGAWCVGDQRLELYPSGLAVGLREGSRVEGVAWLQGGRWLAMEWHVAGLAWLDLRELARGPGGRMVLSAAGASVTLRRC